MCNPQLRQCQDNNRASYELIDDAAAATSAPRCPSYTPRSTFPCSSRSAATSDRTGQRSCQPPHAPHGTCSRSPRPEPWSRVFLSSNPKNAPSPGKACRVFHVDLEPHPVGSLVVAFLVDRAFPFSHALLQHQHRLVGPSPGLDKDLVRRRVDEHVIEHVMVCALRSRVVTHIESRGEIDPLAIVLRQFQLAVARVFRPLRGLSNGRECENQHCAQKQRFHSNQHARSMNPAALERQPTACTGNATGCMIALKPFTAFAQGGTPYPCLYRSCARSSAR